MSTRIHKTEVVSRLKDGSMSAVNACRHLRKMGRQTNALSTSEKKKLYAFDQIPLEKIAITDIPAYAQLLTKAVPNGASAERPKPTPKPKATVVTKKPTPRGPVSAATMAKVKAEKDRKAAALATDRIKAKYAPTMQERFAAAARVVKNTFRLS